MTHINAYHGTVEEKKTALAIAQGEYDSAVAALKDHPDYEAPAEELVEKQAEEDSKAEESIPVKVTKKK